MSPGTSRASSDNRSVHGRGRPPPSSAVWGAACPTCLPGAKAGRTPLAYDGRVARPASSALVRGFDAGGLGRTCHNASRTMPKRSQPGLSKRSARSLPIDGRCGARQPLGRIGEFRSWSASRLRNDRRRLDPFWVFFSLLHWPPNFNTRPPLFLESSGSARNGLDPARANTMPNPVPPSSSLGPCTGECGPRPRKRVLMVRGPGVQNPDRSNRAVCTDGEANLPQVPLRGRSSLAVGTSPWATRTRVPRPRRRRPAEPRTAVATRGRLGQPGTRRSLSWAVHLLLERPPGGR